MKNQKGFAQIVLIILLLVGIVVVSAASYYVLKSKGQAPVSTKAVVQQIYPTSSPAISTSIDTKTIEKELNSTNIDSIDSDLNSLDISAKTF